MRRRRGKWAPYGRELHLYPRSFPLDSNFDPCAGQDHQPFIYHDRGYYSKHCQVCGCRLGDWFEEGTDKPVPALKQSDIKALKTFLEKPL